MVTNEKHLLEALLISTHSIHFPGEIKKKILCGYPLLSGAMFIEYCYVNKYIVYTTKLLRFLLSEHNGLNFLCRI